MARIHGRNGRLLVGVTTGAAASLVAYITNFELNAATDKTEVTAYGDTAKTYVAGLPDATGQFSGFFDTATPQTYTAAVDGLARNFYFYPDFTGSVGIYWAGTAFFDFSISAGVGDAVGISGSWSAATPVFKVG